MYKPTKYLTIAFRKKARIKKFPNHFTDVYLLLDNLDKFGFRLRHGFAFLRRGDFGQNKYVDILKQKPKHFYEYLLIVERLKKNSTAKKMLRICSSYSRTTLKIQKTNG